MTGSERSLVQSDGLPELGILVEAANEALHPAVHSWVSTADRKKALAEELAWWLDVAARDFQYARDYQAHQPQSGAPAECFLDRWLPVSGDLMALAGPRYRDRDPHRPFVGITATSRPLTEADVDAIRDLAHRHFSVFEPGYVLLWTSKAAGAWRGTGSDSRLLAAPLVHLRSRRVDPELSLHRETDLSNYERYISLHRKSRALSPPEWLNDRPESPETFGALVSSGMAWSVEATGRWAGFLAARDDVARGMRGACIVELMLEPMFRGRGYGPHLSVLLAQHLPHPDDLCLFGTIHHANAPAYRSAVRAGRIDVGGEVILPL